MNTKLSFATLALGSFLTLLAPAAAVARDGNDFRQNIDRQYNDRGYTNGYNASFRNRETPREKALRLRLEREDK